MIKITATVSSLQQAEQLVVAGVDCLYFGEAAFGLRLPNSFTRAEQKSLVQIAHQQGKQVAIACNALLHPDQIEQWPEYLAFLTELEVDQLVLGDPGAVYLLQQAESQLAYSFDGGPLITNARQANFWAQHGAASVVLAHEITREELDLMAPQLQLVPELLVYGPASIHHSKRPLLQNYFQYNQQVHAYGQQSGLFLTEPEAKATHYGIYEDQHGTHIFADQDIQLLSALPHLLELGFHNWKLDGLFCSEAAFVAIASAFVAARTALLAGTWSPELESSLKEKICTHHPTLRGLDQGFYPLAAKDIQ